jgi:hypothetical protein
MILSTAQQVLEYTSNGWWGVQTLNDLFDATVKESVGALALVDQPNRAEFTSGESKRLTYAECARLVARLAESDGSWPLALYAPNGRLASLGPDIMSILLLRVSGDILLEQSMENALAIANVSNAPPHSSRYRRAGRLAID